MPRTDKEQAAADNRAWKTANPDKVKEQRKRYNERIKEKNIECGCGALVSKKNKWKHECSKAHLGWLEDGQPRYYIINTDEGKAHVEYPRAIEYRRNLPPLIIISSKPHEQHADKLAKA